MQKAGVVKIESLRGRVKAFANRIFFSTTRRLSTMTEIDAERKPGDITNGEPTLKSHGITGE